MNSFQEWRYVLIVLLSSKSSLCPFSVSGFENLTEVPFRESFCQDLSSIGCHSYLKYNPQIYQKYHQIFCKAFCLKQTRICIGNCVVFGEHADLIGQLFRGFRSTLQEITAELYESTLTLKTCMTTLLKSASYTIQGHITST